MDELRRLQGEFGPPSAHARALPRTVAVTGGSTSVLVRMAETERMAQIPRSAGQKFRLVLSSDHYDGVYFYAVAVDPVARGLAHRLIDHGAYRYSHGGYGLLAWLFS